ncbi:MAG: low temperature requirement protein A [Alphaproteobacteria bacterium]|nr:low temperature requirement protein A [Alphaproteobacteria bacterium]
MASRWIHAPRLHSPLTGKERRVGWLELFYDLIYVATIIQLGNALSEHVGVGGFLVFAGLMVPLWATWTDFTFYSNRFVIDDAPHRSLVFLQMFAIGGMAVSVPDVMEGEPARFAAFYTAARVVLVVLYARMWVQEPISRDLSRRSVIGFGLGALAWGISIFVPAPWCYALWALGIVLDSTATLSRPAQDLAARFPPDGMHTTERYGLLTIIVLGESFVKVLSEVADRGISADVVLMGTFGLLITCALWWIYFDDVAGSRIRRERLSVFTWIYTHLPLTIGITAVGVAIKKAVLMDPGDTAYLKYRLLLTGTLVIVLLSVGLIDAVTERRAAHLSDRTRVKARVITAGVVLLVAFIGQFVPAALWLGGITLVLGAQVVFDISMAPDVVDHHHEAMHDSHAMLDEADAFDPESLDQGVRKRWDIKDVVRRGAPNELRKDLYFLFIEGSWTQALLGIGALFVLINLVFAALYMVEPWSVTGLEQGGFLEAFSFSVQTFATIGYGAMSPDTAWAHAISIVEAGVALMFTAIATGLMFAKASRPRSSVLFSKVCTVHEHHGVPTLIFRAGNARGNEVVEASVNVAALIEDISPEGMTMRKSVDLKLVRSTSPIFTMSWMVMHPLDADSPLHGLTAENVEQRLDRIIVTLVGFDATYAQQTHARKLYYPEDLRFGHQFVDVITNLDDGRMIIDFGPFHQTRAVDPGPEGQGPQSQGSGA